MTSKLSIEFKSSEEKDVEQVMNEVKKIIAKWNQMLNLARRKK